MDDERCKRNPNWIKLSVIIDGHKTSVSLEPDFVRGLKQAAAEDGKTINALVGEIEVWRRSYGPPNYKVSSAIRVWLWLRSQHKNKELAAANATRPRREDAHLSADSESVHHTGVV